MGNDTGEKETPEGGKRKKKENFDKGGVGGEK